MALANELLLGFAIMVVVSIILGSTGRSGASSLRSFYWGNNELAAGHGAHLMISSPFSMNGIMYQTWLGYSIGWAAVLLQVAWCASYIILALFGKKIEALCRRGTMHGAIGGVFGPKAEQAAAIASTIGFALQVGWELIVGVSIFLVVAPNNKALQTVLILSLAAIAAIYTILGGLRGNLNANRLQNYVAGAGLWAVIIFLILYGPSLGTGQAGTHPWDGGSLGRMVPVLGIIGLLTNVVFSLVWQFVDMSTWQNMAATRKEEGVPMLLWSAFWIFVFPGVVGTLAGMYLRTVPDLTSDNIVPKLIESLVAHPLLAIAVTAGFVAAMLSTIDGLLLASAQAITWDLTRRRIVRRLLGLDTLRTASKELDPQAKLNNAPNAMSDDNETKDQQDEQRVLQETRLWVLFIALAAAGLTHWFTVKYQVSIFDLVYIVTIAQMVLLPVVLTILVADPVNRRFGTLSIVGGLLAGIGMVAYGIPTHNESLLAVSPLIALGTAIVLWIPSLFAKAAQ